MREKFNGPPKFVGVDVETHALAPKSGSPDWRTDEFGFQTKASEEALSTLRLVQLGWARPGEGAPHIETRLIKPIGFSIDREATEKHRIAHEDAAAAVVGGNSLRGLP